jgi:hypothetical protein
MVDSPSKGAGPVAPLDAGSIALLRRLRSWIWTIGGRCAQIAPGFRLCPAVLACTRDAYPWRPSPIIRCSVGFHDAIIRFNGRSCRVAPMSHATQRDISLRDSHITTHRAATSPDTVRLRLLQLRVLCVKFCKGGRGRAGLGGLAEVGFLVLLKIVHVEVAVGFEPVFVGLDG